MSSKLRNKINIDAKRGARRRPGRLDFQISYYSSWEFVTLPADKCLYSEDPFIVSVPVGGPFLLTDNARKPFWCGLIVENNQLGIYFTHFTPP